MEKSLREGNCQHVGGRTMANAFLEDFASVSRSSDQMNKGCLIGLLKFSRDYCALLEKRFAYRSHWWTL